MINSKTHTLLLIFLVASARAACVAGDCTDTVPADAILFAHLDIKEQDQGQKWLFNELTRYLIARGQGEEGRPALGEINLCRFSDFCFALLPPDSQDHVQMLMAATLLSSNGTFGVTYGDQKFQLNVRNTETATKTQTQLLTYLLGIACKIPSWSVPEDGIFSNPVTGKKGKFSAYSVSDSRAVMATNRQIVKVALAGKGGLASSPSCRETMSLLPKGLDLYGYAQNDRSSLSKLLSGKKNGWYTFVLMLLGPAKQGGLALDVIDKDQSSVALVLIPNNPQEIHELRMRLEQTLALLMAQYLDPQIKSAIQYEELAGALRINAKLTSTSSFWREAFRVKSASRAPARQNGKTKGAQQGSAGSPPQESVETQHAPEGAAGL